MSFLDAFSDDMSTLTRKSRTFSKNEIGETQESGSTTTPIQGIFMPIGVISDDNKRIMRQILYTKSTHIFYFDHEVYSLDDHDTLIDEQGNEYEIKQIEGVPDFGGSIDHSTSFLVHIA